MPQSLEWTNELIDEFWSYYAKYRPEDYFTYQFSDQILKATLRYVNKDSVICDYGCGDGYLLEKILEKFKAAGFEQTRDNITIANERLDGKPNYLGVFGIDDIFDYTHQFDVIYLIETIEHVLDRHFQTLMSNLKLLLKDDGVLIITTPNDEDLMGDTVYCPCCKKLFHRWQHIRSFDGNSLSRLMSKNGFDLVEFKTLDFAAKTFVQHIKVTLLRLLNRKLPHLIYVGKKA